MYEHYMSQEVALGFVGQRVRIRWTDSYRFGMHNQLCIPIRVLAPRRGGSAYSSDNGRLEVLLVSSKTITSIRLSHIHQVFHEDDVCCTGELFYNRQDIEEDTSPLAAFSSPARKRATTQTKL